MLLFHIVFSIQVEAQELPPALPSGFYGTVMVDGAFAEVGTTIIAKEGGEEYITEVFNFSGKSVYHIMISGGASLEGSEILFFVGDAQADQANAEWHSGTNITLDLTFTISTEEVYKFFFPIFLL